MIAFPVAKAAIGGYDDIRHVEPSHSATRVPSHLGGVMAQRPAFSLIETLVVIAVIAVVIALVIPAT